MIKQEKNNVTILTFEKFTGIKHCFSTRLGGVSEGPFASMNLGFSRGDDDKNVLENYKKIAEAMDVDYTKMCLSKQTHTTNVKVITCKDAGNGIVRENAFNDVDGMITNVEGLTLVTFFADCVPLYFYDPINKAIGLSHSGWRGTVGKIGKKTVELMSKTYGSNPKDIIAAVGPSICKDCYEISKDVADEFVNAFGAETSQKILAPSIYNRNNSDKFMLDLWLANKMIFLEAGILEDNIEITDFCTKCHPDLFFSHRIMGPTRGSLAAFMCL